MKTGYKVSDLMTASPIKLDILSTAKDCAEIMEKNDVGSVLITKNNKLAGIVTEEDLVKKVVKNDLIASKVPIVKIMTSVKDIISIEPNKDIHDALVVMKENDIRRLPVMTKNELHGLITSKDILKIQPDLFELLADTFELRESKRKLNLLEDGD